MSYKEEYEALWAWYDQKTEEYIKTSREEILSGKIKGLDSELEVIHKQDLIEFNRRLDALKAKYGIDP
jgi:hypothetical protein